MPVTKALSPSAHRPKHINRFRGIHTGEPKGNLSDEYVESSHNADSLRLRTLRTRWGLARDQDTYYRGSLKNVVMETKAKALS